MAIPTDTKARSTRWQRFLRWFDSEAGGNEMPPANEADRIDWMRCVPFILLHIACFAVIWVGFSWVALGVAIALYVLRMFAITGFYHRYFSHRTFRTSRLFQFVMAVLGSSAAQRGPMWWAAHHRHHHNHSDDEHDIHSPRHHGLLRSHAGWFMTPAGFVTRRRYVRDWARYPELRWLDRLDWLVPAFLAVLLFTTGAVLHRVAPELGVTGWQLFVWGFVISTVVVYHATYTINSLAHRFGRQRFDTGDDSRNNFWLALLTLGEGWHNNHHFFPASARQGFRWWEIDLTYYGLVVLKWMGLIWDLRPVPQRVLALHEAAGAKQ